MAMAPMVLEELARLVRPVLLLAANGPAAQEETARPGALGAAAGAAVLVAVPKTMEEDGSSVHLEAAAVQADAVVAAAAVVEPEAARFAFSSIAVPRR